jgi:hypothetical protein
VLVSGLTLVGLIILALGVLGGWVGFAIALVLMILGVVALSRCVHWITQTNSNPEQPRRGSAGRNDALYITDDAREDISPHDTPLDSPAHREAVRRLHKTEHAPLPAGQQHPKS